MNLAQISRLLSGFVLFFALAQLLPLAIALGEDHHPFDATVGFGVGTAFGLGTATILWLIGRRARSDFFRKEGLAMVGFAWLLSGVLGGVPFWAAGVLQSPADAVFESVSGLTTTGASVLGTADNPAIEALPHSILLWRSLLQWLGGLGIVLVFLVLLPAMGVTGKNLLASEQVGVASDSMRPRLQEQARALFRLYGALTMAMAVLLWLFGMPGFDAVCHAFTTMATGGFSTKNASIGAYDSVAIELVVVVFMFLAGCNFALMLAAARGRLAAGPRLLWRNPELRGYVLLTAIAIAIVTISLWTWGGQVHDTAVGNVRDYTSLPRCLRDATFQVVSLITSTGFATADFQVWPAAAVMVFLLCMLIGASSGSTAGGLKVVRVLVGGRLAAFHLRRFVRPKSVEKLKLGGEVVGDHTVSAIAALVVLWLFVLLVGAFVLSLEKGIDFLAATSASASTLGCTGPALSSVTPLPDGSFELSNSAGLNLGPYGGYGQLSALSKLYLCLQMIFGRLEILAPLVLLVPGFWRR